MGREYTGMNMIRKPSLSIVRLAGPDAAWKPVGTNEDQARLPCQLAVDRSQWRQPAEMERRDLGSRNYGLS
jgi:hypothetical protein